MKKFALIIIALTVNASCSDQDGLQQPATETVLKRTELSESKYLSDIESLSYPSLNISNKSHKLTWDFSPSKEYQFNYSQRVNSFSDMGEIMGKSTNSEQRLTTTGQLTIKSQKEKKARLILEGLTAKIEITSPSSEPKSMTQSVPTMVIEGMNESGRLPEGGISQDLLFKLLFPMPEESISLGETTVVPIKMPFNANGSPLFVHGTMELTMTDLVNCNGDQCAQLDSVIRLDKFTQPPEIQGNYSAQALGKGRAFFSIKKRRFVEGASALLMKINATIVMPKVDGMKSDQPTMPETISMSMVSDNLIRISEI